jgi:hypothetical protein
LSIAFAAFDFRFGMRSANGSFHSVSCDRNVTTWSRGRDSENEFSFLEVDVSQFGSAFFLVVCGVVGAALSVTLLLLVPTDGAPLGYSELIANDLPALIFTAAIGLCAGVLVAVLWAFLQRIFAVRVPRV